MTQEVQLDATSLDQTEPPLVELLQRSGCARLLDAFLSNRGFWLTEAHLEEIAEVHQSTVNRNKTAFEEIELIETRGSHPTEYRLNEDHPAAEPLIEAHRELHRNIADMNGAKESEEIESPFYLLLKTEGRVRILDAFLSNRGFWLTESQLEDIAQINQSTANRHLDALEELDQIDIIKSKDTRPKQYRLDEEHRAVPSLLDAHRKLHLNVSELTNHSWDVQVPTVQSARDEVQSALGDLEIDFRAQFGVNQQAASDTTEKSSSGPVSDSEDDIEQRFQRLLEEYLPSSDNTDDDNIGQSEGKIEFRETTLDKSAAAADIRNNSAPQTA